MLRVAKRYRRKKQMKKQFLLGLSLISILSLGGCSSSSENAGSDYSYNSTISVSSPSDISVPEITGDFSLVTSDGHFSQNNNIYTIDSAGTYVANGRLEGQILISASESDEVILELQGAAVIYDQDSPIKVTSANNVEISAKKDTGNIVRDNRAAKTADIAALGEAAIYASSDLKIKGNGILVVEGNYNNGVHSAKDLKIQNLTTKIIGYNNAIKGNNSITIESGVIQAYSKTNDGLKTEDSDVTSSGKQKGTITINGGSIYVDSLRDAFDASYNVEISEADSSIPTEITIRTGKNSAYYNSSSFSADSEKGIKATNEIIVNKGTVVIAASDDAIHANYGTTLGNGSKGVGNITINDGLIEVASGDDGLHADNTLSISGGKVVVTGSTEGFEANYITITGGQSYIYGNNDGVNCSKKSFNSCSFTMSGGYLDVAVRSGDTDGIDSNGDFTLSGGTIVTRGSPGNAGNMSTGLDVDGTCSMTGGTLISFNGLEVSPNTGSGVLYAGTTQSSGGQGGGGHRNNAAGSSYSFEAGNYVLSGGDLNISFSNDYSYSSFLIYSSSLATGNSYTLSVGGSTLLSWSQSSNSVTI